MWLTTSKCWNSVVRSTDPNIYHGCKAKITTQSSCNENTLYLSSRPLWEGRKYFPIRLTFMGGISVHLKCMGGYTSIIFCHFYQVGDNFCDFLTASLDEKKLLKRDLIFQFCEKLNSNWKEGLFSFCPILTMMFLSRLKWRIPSISTFGSVSSPIWRGEFCVFLRREAKM